MFVEQDQKGQTVTLVPTQEFYSWTEQTQGSAVTYNFLEDLGMG